MGRGQVDVFERSLTSLWINRRPDRVLGYSTVQSGPLVSCLMVSRGNVAMVRSAIGYFRRQTYLDKELVVVSAGVTPALTELVAESGSDVRLVLADSPVTLGGLRNISIANATGEIICQWDDDDLYGMHRLERGVGALLRTGADAAFLRQLLLWVPAQRVFSLSEGRLWEGSMIARKASLPAFPDLPRHEDTAAIEPVVRQWIVAVLDDPLSYCYCAHGNNTSLHFDRIIERARLSFAYERALPSFGRGLWLAQHPAATEGDRRLAKGRPPLGPQAQLKSYLMRWRLLQHIRYRVSRAGKRLRLPNGKAKA